MDDEPGDRTASGRRWGVLAAGLLAQLAGSLFIYGIATVLPNIRSEGHASLGQAGLVIAAPAAGLLLSLYAWGALADRIGERVVIVSGMAISGAALALTPLAGGLDDRPHLALGAWSALLAIAGSGAASVNAASGRLVLGWFSPRERGRAMGIRQTAQPLGVAAAGLLLPPTADAWGVWWCLAIPAAICLATAVLVWAVAADPPRPAGTNADGSAAPAVASPYREAMLYRVHLSSTLLVVPQFVVASFALAYLVSVRDWHAVDAGRVVFAGQLLGALGRLGAGLWTDLARSRLRPMRTLAVLSGVVMLACFALDAASSPAIVAVLVIASVVTVCDNGMAYTAVAERAGPFWAGRALGAHNTAQNLVAVLAPSLLGLLVSAHGYGAAFLVAACAAVLAIGTVPVRDEAPWDAPAPAVRRMIREKPAA